MNYNERLIQAYGEKELKSLLANPARYRALVMGKLSRERNDCQLNDLAIIDALDNYIVKMINSHPNELNKADVIAYRDFLYGVYRSQKKMALDSILFKKGNCDLIFSKEQVTDISSYKRETTRSVNEELKKLISVPGQTASTELLRFAEVQIGIENDRVKNFLDNLFQYILRNQDANKSYYAREFLARYTSYINSSKLNIPPVEVYLSNYDLNGKKQKKGELGASYGNTGIVIVSKDYALDKYSADELLPNFMSIIQTVCHEVKHSSQAYNTTRNNISLESFNYIRYSLFKKYLSTEKFDEYSSNYIHNEIENDSNFYGWRQTESIIKKYAPEMEKQLSVVVSKSIVTAFQEETATKINSAMTKRVSKERFNVENMDLIVRSHPEVLNIYPLLRQIYSPNGKRKSFVERLKIESTSSNASELAKIYGDYNTYSFQTGEVQRTDVNSLDVDTQLLFFGKIFDMTLDEMKSLKNSIKVCNHYSGYNDFRTKEFSVMTKARAKRIKDLINYINSNKNLILQLDRINHSSGKNRVFMIVFDFIERELNSVKRYIDKLKIQYTGDNEKAAMMSELESLEQVEVFKNENRK